MPDDERAASKSPIYILKSEPLWPPTLERNGKKRAVNSILGQRVLHGEGVVVPRRATSLVESSGGQNAARENAAVAALSVVSAAADAHRGASAPTPGMAASAAAFCDDSAGHQARCCEEDNRRWDEIKKGVGKPCARAIRPIYIILCAYGIVPMGFGEMRLSLHPFKSTLLYVVAVQSLVALSAESVFASYYNVLHSEAEDASAVDTQLLALQAVLHVSSHLIMFIVWPELPFVKRRLATWVEFAMSHAHMIGEVRLARRTRIIPWLIAGLAFLVIPLFVAVWCQYITRSPDRWHHYPAHLYQTVFVSTCFSYFAVSCLMVRDLADTLAESLDRELSTGRMLASRLEEFRLAWLCLRKLAVNLGTLPLTGMSLLGYLLVMITLCAYQTFVSFSKGLGVLFVSSLSLLILFEGMFVGVCDAAHRLADKLTGDFAEILEARSLRGFPPDFRKEYDQFLRMIASNPAAVTLAGTVSINRSTVISMMAAIMTYLIVLFQLRESEETNTKPKGPTR